MRNTPAGLCAAFGAGDLGEAEQKTQVPGLTFGSFSYERNGFASFATKRSLKFVFRERYKQFYAQFMHSVIRTNFSQ